MITVECKASTAPVISKGFYMQQSVQADEGGEQDRPEQVQIAPPRLAPVGADLRDCLESLYRTWNRRRFVHPDPLETLYAYPDPGDQEIVGLVAAGLAYGRVAQILASIGKALAVLGPSPAAFLRETSARSLARAHAMKPRFLPRYSSGKPMLQKRYAGAIP